MTEKHTSRSAPQRPRSIFRKRLLLPAEHGSWSWFLVPFAAGVIVAGSWTTITWLVLLGGLALFFMRTPATVWVRIRSGRGRRADEPLAAGWTLAFGALALLSLAGLLALGASTLLWLLIPIIPLLAANLLLGFSKPSNVRTLWMELAGAAGLALMAPAAYLAGGEPLVSVAFWLWLLFTLQDGLGVLYVRRRLADTHRRPTPRAPLLLGHVAALTTVSLLVLNGQFWWPALVPFIVFTARAIWAVGQPRPLSNIKRFGFLEIGVEIAGALCFILAFV